VKIVLKNGGAKYNNGLKIRVPIGCIFHKEAYTFQHMNDPSPKSYYSPELETEKHRHRLPHWQQDDAWVFVTWRLADSVPADKLNQWHDDKNRWLECHPKPWDEATEKEYHVLFLQRFENWLDQGAGSCLLKDEANAKIVADAIHFFNGERYELATFVVMPNHVHVLFCPRNGHVISEIVQSWKRFSSREINKRMGASGSLWQEEYWDRLIRNEKHFYAVAGYIRRNPEKAGLKNGYILWDRGTNRWAI